MLGKNYERIDHLEKPVCIFAGASILLYIIFSWIYPFLDVYIDHVEPAVVITSILLLRGQEVYPDWTQGGAIYGMIYGPLLYFIHAAFLYASPTIAFSKLAAVIAIWMAIAILAFEFFRLTKSYIVTLLSIACVIVIFSFFGNFTFWNRPEPFLILLSAAALPTLRLK